MRTNQTTLTDPLTGEVEEAIHDGVGDDTTHGQQVEHSECDQQYLVTGRRVGLKTKLDGRGTI